MLECVRWQNTFEWKTTAVRGNRWQLNGLGSCMGVRVCASVYFHILHVCGCVYEAAFEKPQCLSFLQSKEYLVRRDSPVFGIDHSSCWEYNKMCRSFECTHKDTTRVRQSRTAINIYGIEVFDAQCKCNPEGLFHLLSMNKWRKLIDATMWFRFDRI